MNKQAILYPRTWADFNQITEWIMMGLSNSEVFEKMTNSLWRSEVTEFRGHLFCHQCEQLITLSHCIECGQTVPPVQPSLFDCQTATIGSRYQPKFKNKWRR